MLTGILSAIILTAVPAVDDPKLEKNYPDPGSNIPGPFHAWNVTGKKKGFYHCLVSHHALNPVVMVIISGVEGNAPLVPFLKTLDTRIIHNPDTRLAGFVVFHEPTFADQIRDDDEKEKLDLRIGDVQSQAGLTKVTLTLTPKAKIEKYLKDKDAEVTVVIYNKLRTLSVHSFATKKDFKPDAIIKELEATIGASRTGE